MRKPQTQYRVTFSVPLASITQIPCFTELFLTDATTSYATFVPLLAGNGFFAGAEY